MFKIIQVLDYASSRVDEVTDEVSGSSIWNELGFLLSSWHILCYGGFLSFFFLLFFKILYDFEFGPSISFSNLCCCISILHSYFFRVNWRESYLSQNCYTQIWALCQESYLGINSRTLCLLSVVLTKYLPCSFWCDYTV